MYKCKICGKKYTELTALYNHIETKHKEMIPKDMSVQQYYYYMKTGKMNGNCVMCKQPTSWNSNTGKYNRFCGNPKCKDEYVKIMKSRMVAKYGKTHLLNDPTKQREMLANRSISGVYKWSDGKHETTYTGSYELDFLKTLDGFFDWDPEDISMPSPHTYTYKYEGEDKFYIPDVFIHSLDLEIEIKDGGDNPNNHYKIQAIDKHKEALKDEVMCSQKAFHYIKITNKNYENFFDFLKEAKKAFEKYEDESKIPRIFKIEDIKGNYTIKESTEVIEENYIFDGNDICLNLDKFEKGEKHILFITGHSGSGKSTLGKELAKKYNAEYVELDYLTAIDHKPTIKNTIFEEYVKEKGLENFIPGNVSEDEYNMFVYKFIEWLMYEKTQRKMVVEGIQIFCVGDPNVIKDYPIIIKNVSAINSLIRARKRDYSNNWISFIKNLPKEIGWRLNDEKYFRKFRKGVMENADVIEEGMIDKSISLFTGLGKNKSHRELDHILSINYDLVKNNPEELKNFLQRLANSVHSIDDVEYVRHLNKKSRDHCQLMIKRMPETKDPYKEYYNWIIEGGVEKDLKTRCKNKKIKESFEPVEENLLFSRDNIEFNIEKFGKEINDPINTLNESLEIIEEKMNIDRALVWLEKPIEKLTNKNIKIYRGSSVLLDDVIEPRSINVGSTRLSNPRWSTYFWDNKEDAIKWEVSQIMEDRYKYTVYIGHEGKTLLGKPKDVNEKEFIKSFIADFPTFYVYEADINIHDLEMGSGSIIREYVVSKPVKITKRYEYKLNKELMRRCFQIVDIEVIEKMKEQSKGAHKLDRFGNHRNPLLSKILDNNRDLYRAIIRTDMEFGNVKVGDDLSGYRKSINYNLDNNTYGTRESYIIDRMEESSISIPQMSMYLQNEYEEEMRNYLNTYKKYYNLMLKEQPSAVEHINEDIRKCLIVIDGLAEKGVENNLVQFAKDDLGEIVKASKKGKPVKVYEASNILNCKIAYKGNNSQLFSLRDTNSKLIIENSYVIQRDKVGTHCSVTPYYKDIDIENVFEFQLILDKDINITELSKINDGINIANLHKINDSEYKFIKESCLKLFGIYPKEIKFK